MNFINIIKKKEEKIDIIFFFGLINNILLKVLNKCILI